MEELNQQMAVHYSNSGFVYATSTETNYFQYPPECYNSHAHLHYHYASPPPPLMHHHHQDFAYWPIYMNYYRFGASIPGAYDVDINNQLSRMEISGRAWEYASAAVNIEEIITEEAVPCEDTTPPTIMLPIPEECTGNPQEDVVDEASDHGSEVDWQDDIDPDTMTYEELLDLGETVGTQSRGLSQETIDLLPKTKYKSTGIFTRRRSAERCVICQMRYKRGDHQIHLPCKHIYHTDCGSTWLKINKACPICNGEVFSDEVKH